MVKEALRDGLVKFQQHSHNRERFAVHSRHCRIRRFGGCGLPQVVEIGSISIVLLHEEMQISLVLDDGNNILARQATIALGEPSHG